MGETNEGRGREQEEAEECGNPAGHAQVSQWWCLIPDAEETGSEESFHIGIRFQASELQSRSASGISVHNS